MQSKRSKRQHKLLIGITGGIGSGKSLVCEYLSELGCNIFYADKIARDLYFSNRALKRKLVKEFGEKILDEKKNISFDNFRKVVFSSDSNQKRVNKIVHPFVIDEILKRARKTSTKTVVTKTNVKTATPSGSPLIFIEAALIFESSFDKYLDYTVEVFATVSNRIRWVGKRNNMKRNNITPSLIRSVMKLQMKESEKCKRADFVIKNNSTKAALKTKARFLYNIFQHCTS